MKEVKAYIKKHKLSDVVWALHKIDGLTGLTMVDVHGFGRGKAKNSKEKVTVSSIDCIPKVKLEIMCLDNLTESVVNAIQKSAHTGLPGDGKIYVSDVEQAIRVSTNERNEGAI